MRLYYPATFLDETLLRAKSTKGPRKWDFLKMLLQSVGLQRGRASPVLSKWPRTPEEVLKFSVAWLGWVYVCDHVQAAASGMILLSK